MFLGNERWANGTWTASGRPLKLKTVPQSLKTIMTHSSFMNYNALKLDITVVAEGKISPTYGSQSLPAICEYGKPAYYLAYVLAIYI